MRPINYTVDKKITLQINIRETRLDGGLGAEGEQHSTGLPAQPAEPPQPNLGEEFVGIYSGMSIGVNPVWVI